ncbi:MAG: hypothetical protein E5W09_01450 [Mesorhizobium sp.]|nr:MAG: hypothetical protein E5W09_01450 [Mesorhizobium sp.]
MRAFPLADAVQEPECVPPCLLVAGNSHRESDEAYCATVARLNAGWRVIECRDGIQWILQRMDGERHGRARWTGRSYCRTREALIHVCRGNAREIDATAGAALDSLPDWIGGRP